MEERDPGPLAGPHDPERARAQAERLLAAWKTPTGWRYWSTVNNTVVGVWYTAAAFRVPTRRLPLT